MRKRLYLLSTPWLSMLSMGTVWAEPFCAGGAMDIKLGTFYSHEIHEKQLFKEIGTNFNCSSFGLSAMVAPHLSVTLKSKNGGKLNSTGLASSVDYKIYASADKSTELVLDKEVVLHQSFWNIAGGSASGSTKLYLETQPGQRTGAALIAGTHSDDLSVRWNWSICTVGALGLCASWATGSTETHFNLSLSIDKSCLFSSSSQPSLNFGAYPLVEMYKPIMGSVSVMCTRQQPFNLSITDGDNAAGGWRRMKGPGGDYIEYQLYIPGTQTVLDTTNRLEGTGQGHFTDLSFEGRINTHQPNVGQGTYIDRPVVMIEY